MVINIFGGGGSGKTTLQFALLGRDGFINLVPFTTRSRRFGEKDGVHYRFITGEVFSRTELTLKRVADGSLYGVALNDLYTPGFVVTTFDLNGISELEKLNLDARIVYLNIPEVERVFRMLSRGDSREAVMRRVAADRVYIRYPKTVYPILEIQGGTLEEIMDQVLIFIR